MKRGDVVDYGNNFICIYVKYICEESIAGVEYTASIHALRYIYITKNTRELAFRITDKEQMFDGKFIPELVECRAKLVLKLKMRIV